MSPHKVDILPSTSALASYGISKNGFLPAEAPLRQLPDTYYTPWESLIDQLPAFLQAGCFREAVDALPVLETSGLQNKRELQRAYSLLAVVAQAYVWQGPEPSEVRQAVRYIVRDSWTDEQQRLPPQVSKPFLQVAAALEVVPVATYAALNLWNWRPTPASADLSEPDNMQSLHTLTGSDDESWFYTISNAMEARAGPIIARSLAAMEAVSLDDSETVVETLEYFQQSIEEIGQLLERMDERCRPQVFYHEIRPFLAGSMNMEVAGLPKGVFYDEGDGKGSWRKYRGGSNGQSSLLQFFDAVLGVKHERCSGFHTEMRKYMPGPHARFLQDIESIANIRSYVDSHQKNTELVAAYNGAVASLSGFRDKHIQLVTRYIILPSRMSKPDHHTGRVDLATTSTKLARGKQSIHELVGTGGTKLIPFLRTSRDETSEAAVVK